MEELRVVNNYAKKEKKKKNSPRFLGDDDDDDDDGCLFEGTGESGTREDVKSRRRNESRIGRIPVFLLSGPIKN